MELKFLIILFAILLTVSVEGKKSGRSRGSGSGRGTSRKTNNPQPAPTSLSYPQPAAAKPSFSGWQEHSAQKTKPSNSQTHSYPSGGTGLSGNKPKQTSTNQENIQRSSASNNLAAQQGSANNQPGHSYPSSGGLSGSSGSGYPQQTGPKYPQQQATGLSGSGGNGQAGYPQSPGSGLSGSGQPGNTHPQQHSGSAYPQQMGGGYPQQGSGGYPQQSSGGYAQQGGGGYPQAPPPYSGYPQAPPPYSGYRPGDTNRQYHHPQGPPPPYTNVGPHYGGYGGHGPPGYGSQMPGYFGNYGKGNSGVSRVGTLAGVGLAGAGIGTVITGLALWNMARSTGRSHHTVIYDNRGQPVAVEPTNDTASATDSLLADLVNCSLTISNENKTEVLAIPCAIATSFTPEADVKDTSINENKNDNTKCTITVLTKTDKEFMTTIPCSILLNTAAENNVTEPAVIENEPGNLNNSTNETENLKDGVVNNTALIDPMALELTGNNSFSNLNCTLVPEEGRDPINPCYSVNYNLTVIPLSTTNVPN